MVSSGKKNYRCFIGYMDDDCKTKRFSIIPKTSAYVKSCDGETKWMFFVLKMKNY